MDYAYPSNRPFATAKPLKTKTVLSEEAKARRAYIRSHEFSVHVDPLTKEATLEVKEK
jgi:hypothetical protein